MFLETNEKLWEYRSITEMVLQRKKTILSQLNLLLFLGKLSRTNLITLI